ncbi:MAG: hypothetical protein JST00_37350 [Deltaproteobacteria bacterium]|nr:hypothetical protein [Deltaproteobacteria bacterium]
MKRIIIVALALGAWACGPSGGDDVGATTSQGVTERSDAITLATWERHPTIVAIRKEVGAVDRAFAAKGAKVERKEDCEGTRAKLVEDGTIRRVETSVDDLELQEARYTYGPNGKVRFAFLHTQSRYGVVDAEVFFDTSGRRIWAVSRMAGEDVEFDVEQAEWEESPDVHLDPDLSTPAKMFDRPARCGAGG